MTAHALTHPTTPVRLIARAIDLCTRIPYSLIAFLARFSIAATFWKSGQTKIEGLAIDILEGTFEFGLPRSWPPSASTCFRC
jgi:putative oxidoreductase